MHLLSLKSTFLLSFCLLIIITGCVTTSLDELDFITEEVPINNRLTFQGHSISIPNNWDFRRNALKSGPLFSFNSPEGIEGGIDCVSFDYEVDLNGLKEMYKTYVFESEKRIRTDILKHEKYGDVFSFSGFLDKRNLYSLVLLDGNDAIFFLFSSPEEIPIEKVKNVALLLLNNYEKDDRMNISVREKENAPLFISLNHNFFWYNDFKDGYLLAKDDVITGIWSITSNELEELKINDNFDIEPFTFNIRVKNENTKFTIYGNRNIKYQSNIYCIFEFDSKIYCLYLITKYIKPEVNLKTFIDKQEIQELFDYNIFFTEGL